MVLLVIIEKSAAEQEIPSTLPVMVLLRMVGLEPILQHIPALLPVFVPTILNPEILASAVSMPSKVTVFVLPSPAESIIGVPIPTRAIPLLT